MTHTRIAPVALVSSALALIALPFVASAATWPSHDEDIDLAASGWTLPENDDRSYVDDGFRAPLKRFTAAWNGYPPALALGDMLDPRFESGYGRRAASSRAATRSMAGVRSSASFPGTATSGGSSSGSIGLGSDVSAVAAGGIPSGLTPLTVKLADLLKPESPDPNSQGPDRNPGADAAVAQLVVTPLPTSGFLMIAGLGGLVPLMLRRRRRTG